jgi:hypothetical protein
VTPYNQHPHRYRVEETRNRNEQGVELLRPPKHRPDLLLDLDVDLLLQLFRVHDDDSFLRQRFLQEKPGAENSR